MKELIVLGIIYIILCLITIWLERQPWWGNFLDKVDKTK